MKMISAPAGLSGEPLAELKQWLAITTTSDDTLLVDLLAAAHAMCERFTGLVAYKSEVRERFAATGLEYALGAQPVLYFLDVTAIDHGLGTRLLTADEASFERTGNDSGTLKLGASIPEPQVEARYYAGLSDDWAMVEGGLRHGIIRYAAHQYRERDAGPAEAPPAAVAALWRPYRRVRL